MVIDASVLASVVGDDGAEGRRARGEVRTAGELAAPDLVDVETVAVLRKRWLARTISDQCFAAAIADLCAFRPIRPPVPVETGHPFRFKPAGVGVACDCSTRSGVSVG